MTVQDLREQINILSAKNRELKKQMDSTNKTKDEFIAILLKSLEDCKSRQDRTEELIEKLHQRIELRITSTRQLSSMNKKLCTKLKTMKQQSKVERAEKRNMKRKIAKMTTILSVYGRKHFLQMMQ